MRIWVVVAVLLVTTSVCVSEGTAADGQVTPQARIDHLIGQVRSNEVKRVEIVQIPPHVLTRTRVTPELLERSFHYKLVIGDIRGGAYAASLASAVGSVSAEPGTDAGDLRWGVTFFDQGDQRITSFYFDASGHRGAIDNTPVAFKGDLFKWLDDNFSRAFK
jgi:hypothetical protein